jgi:hypothetical protein
MPSYGRGGAGNIEAVAQEKERITIDSEANKDAKDCASSSQLPNISQGSSQQYANTGCGGAGNVYSANEIHDMQSPDGPDDIKSTGRSTQSLGRGGDGNYGCAADGSREAAALERMREQRSQERITKDIEKDVEQQLAIPQKAKLARKQTYRR